MRIAVIGCGYWGPNLVRNFSALEGVEVAACCDMQADNLARIAPLAPQAKLLDCPEQLWREDKIDAVAIATPAPTHFDIARQALAEGKDVMVEKPLALTAEQAEALARQAEAGGRILMVGHTFLYNLGVRRLREYIQGDELGEVFYGYSQRLNLGQVRRVENVWWNLAPHDIAIFNYLFDSTPTAVQGHGGVYLQEGVEDVALGVLHYPKGKTAYIHVSWLDPGKVRKVTVVGAKKMIVFDDMQPDALLTLSDKKAVREADEKAPGGYNVRLYSGDVLIPKIPRHEPLRLECQHFVECVRTRQQPLSNGRQGLEVVKILEAVTDSLRNNGRLVEVNSG